MKLTLFCLGRSDGRRAWRRMKLRLRGWPWNATNEERDTWQKPAVNEIGPPLQYGLATGQSAKP